MSRKHGRGVYDLVAIDFALNVRARQAKSEEGRMREKNLKAKAEKRKTDSDCTERRSYAMDEDVC